MASPYERPDRSALVRVESLVQHLGDELTGWRRRALKAEGELQDVKAKGGMGGEEVHEVRQRMIDLETENLALRTRIQEALQRVESLQSRLRFLEHQEDGAHK